MISVIMTAYNAEKYIKQAIESVINQTHREWVLIIVDDCSTDKTYEIADRIRKAYKKNLILLYKNDSNLGHTKSLNVALNYAKGDYVAKMDSDDISEPRRFEEQLKCFHGNIGMVSTHSIAINEKGDRIPDWYCDKAQRRSDLEIKIHLETDNWICGPSMMWKREVFGKIGVFDPKCVIGQDLNFFMRAQEYFGWDVCGMELYRLRRHKSSVRKTEKGRERNWHQYAIKRSKECPIVNL